MDLIQISQEINHRIELMAKGRLELQKRAQAKAESLSEYEKKLATTIMALKPHHPATILEKVARGECWRECLEKDLKEAEYRNAIIGLRTLQAEANCLQTLYKRQEEI